MSRKEQINHRIDITKTALNTLLIAFFGVCAFVFINIEKFSILKLLIATCGGFVVLLMWFIALLLYLKYDKEIGKL